MGEVIQSMIQDTDYRDIHARLERSSPEEQQRAFLHHKNIITERAPRIEQLTKQLEGSEQ
jgi:hypothetical protein